MFQRDASRLGERGGTGGGAERMLLTQHIGQESVKFLIRAGGQKQPAGPDGVALTVVGGLASRGRAPAKRRFCRAKYFSSTRRSSSIRFKTQQTQQPE